MRQRVSLITLGVARPRARAGLLRGARLGDRAEPGDDVVFFQAGDMVVALWDRARLAEDSGVEDGGGWGGVTLALNFGSAEEVDAAIEEARARRGDDRPRAGRDLLGRLQRRLRRPRGPSLGDRPQPALDGHRGRRRPILADPIATRAHLNLVESSRQALRARPRSRPRGRRRLAPRRRQLRPPDDRQRGLSTRRRHRPGRAHRAGAGVLRREEAAASASGRGRGWTRTPT